MTNEQIEDLKREVYAQTFDKGCTGYGAQMIGFTIDILVERGFITAAQTEKREGE